MKNIITLFLFVGAFLMTGFAAPEAISSTNKLSDISFIRNFETVSDSASLVATASSSVHTTESEIIDVHEAQEKKISKTRDQLTGVYTVPYYSQIDDISDPDWKGVSCGIASLAMLIDFYTDPVLPDTLLDAGIASGAYISDAGWSHQGLINLAQNYNLRGFTNTMYEMTMDNAFNVLVDELKDGPVMVSVQYTFTPSNPIPHLVVITGVHDGLVYYADPADGTGSITIEKFQSSWKKRYIAVRPLKMTDK